MKNFFNWEGKVFKIITRLTDLLWLNILTVVCCIPVVTAGASLTAMYSMTLAMVREEEGYITRGFFKAFKKNFLQATAMWLIILGGCLVLWLDVVIVGNYAPQFKNYVLIPMCFILLVLVALYLYVFPLQAYFENTVKGTLSNALRLSVAHLPYTVVFILLQSMPWIIIYNITNPVLLIALGWGLAGIGYLCSFAYRGIFEKYQEPAEEE